MSGSGQVPKSAPLALLDRDGVLNRDTGYVYRSDQVEWIDGALAALARLRSAGYRIAVITNQSGVARGYYSERDVVALHEWMAREIEAKGGKVDAFYYCPFHPEGVVDAYRQDHIDRKPAPGMVLKALADFSADPADAFLVGDQPRDIEAARAAGVRGYLFSGGDLDCQVAVIMNEMTIRGGYA